LAERIFITATNTDVGKTYTTLKLMEQFSLLGYRVGAFKPIETGVIDLPPDGSRLCNAMHEHNPDTRHLGINDIVPLQYRLPAAPFVASGGLAFDVQKSMAALEKIEAHCDVVLIEGAGGLLVPVDATTMMIDLAEKLGATILLVTHCKLGCINDTLLNLNLLKQRTLPYKWVLNCHEDDSAFETVSLPYFETAFGTFYRLENDAQTLCETLIN